MISDQRGNFRTEKSHITLNLKNTDIDDNLISRIQKGNSQAFKLLFEKYATRLYQFSLKYLRDKEDAEDLLNEVFLKLWENRQSLKTGTSFQSYLFTIAYNNIRKCFLKRSREEKYIQLFAEEYLSFSQSGEEQLDYVLFSRKINGIIELLPPRRREIFLLSYKDELKNQEIADKLGVSEQFVKNQLSLARKYIIEKIQEDSHFAGILFLCLFAGENFY